MVFRNVLYSSFFLTYWKGCISEKNRVVFSNFMVSNLCKRLCAVFKMKTEFFAGAHSETCPKCKIELFAKLVNGFQQLIICAKCSILDVSQGFEYASVTIVCPKTRYWFRLLSINLWSYSLFSKFSCQKRWGTLPIFNLPRLGWTKNVFICWKYLIFKLSKAYSR